jgi:2-iminobutanoate/2-iminopropanoate deaminase
MKPSDQSSLYPMAPGQTRHAPPLSTFRRAGDLVFVSGCGAVNDLGEIVSNDFAEQYHYTMRRLLEVLQSAGCEAHHVVSVRAYVQNPSDLPLHNQIYPQYFSEPFPARTTIVSCLPPGLLFEIECVAYVGESTS